ncbi:Porin Gram-negative type [Cupriavidus necator]|uniref:Porin Gram-negative type n=1 Tax=Cupriavidus necator TaxID=106590 RepID=A0A1K0IP44_CUPNE|nr:Porin Gram-negative type [Cupriavidus necator]
MKLKPTGLLVIVATMASGNTMAQSSVTLYGITDLSIRYLTNANSDNAGKLSMENGAITNSRFGFRGTEDLGGMKAIFNLLGNINPDNGTQPGGVLFSRAAFVGLQGSAGTVTLGRQQTAMFDLLVFSFDPLTVGNYNASQWLPVALANGGRADNMIKYAGTFGGLTLGAGYSLGVDSSRTGPAGFSGEQPGSRSRGTQLSLAISYAAGAAAAGAAFQQTRDNAGNRMSVYNLNGSYAVGPAKLYAGYLHSTDDTGSMDRILYALGGRTDTFVPPKGSNRRDDAFFVGVVWQAMPALKLTAAAYYDRSRNAAVNLAGTAFADGRRYAVVGVAEYSLSKRSQLYATLDYNKASGAAVFDFPGKSNQTGFGVGMRHSF